MKTEKALTIALVCMALTVVLLAASNAHADVHTASFTNATQNTDGTPIAATGPGSLSRSAIEYGTCNAARTNIATKVGEITLVPPANSVQVPLVVIQEYCLAAYHSNTFATTFGPGLAFNSARSNVVTVQSVPPTPKPPGGLVVGDFVAYQIVQSPNGLELLAFGHVAPGTPCDMDHSVNGKYLVPWQSVTMPNGQPNTKKLTVLAACS